MKINRLQTSEEITETISKMDLPQIFFTQPQMVDTFINTEHLELYSVEHQSNTYIFFKKLRTLELRLLFEIFPDEVVEYLKSEFNPPYIAYNEFATPTNKPNEIDDKEVVVDIEKYLNLENKRVRKHYHQAVKHNTSIVFKPFKSIPRADIELFWKTWAEQLSSSKEKFKDNTVNDARFLDRYTDNQFFGVVAYDGTKIVAYSIGVEHGEGYCLSSFNKSLRGYTNLGLQVSYEKAKQAKELGYTQMNLAWINNDFKRQFFPFSTLLPIYGFELWRNEEFKTLEPNSYTSVLLR